MRQVSNAVRNSRVSSVEPTRNRYLDTATLFYNRWYRMFSSIWILKPARDFGSGRWESNPHDRLGRLVTGVSQAQTLYFNGITILGIITIERLGV